jgi:hypothetical protein
MTEVVDDKTMVERIAEAIWMENRPEGAPAYADLDFLDQGRVKMIARACIKVMREPTDEMIRAGTISWESMDGSPAVPMFEPTKPYQAMIDAALKED